ncbi:hypothetical protein Bca52824_050029 [Brassica carinata]|uniref:Uncharacterized protein n=1 Tax=Brassica carinata TaxID=52824 RepID=A0A8X7RPF7_BRACI|nr:hypothetical protein Bca52824_050029 [Brassica carinata]
MKVQINGLKPLIMRWTSNFLQRKLLKWSWNMRSLKTLLLRKSRHMKMKIAKPPPSRQGRDQRMLGISQHNTLERIKKAKGRKAGDKLVYNKDNREGARWSNYKYADPRDARSSSHNDPSRIVSERSSGYEENKRRYDDRNVSIRSNPSSRRTLPRREGRDQLSADYVSHSREPLAPPMHNKPGISPIREERSRRNNIADHLSDPLGSNSKSEERICAKDRLSVHTQRTSLNERSESNSNSKHIHNVELQEVDENMHLPVINSITRPSSSNVFDSGRLGPSERSPIRTLSEDRIHVSLRLGPLLQTETEERKRKVGNSQTLRKVGNSPAQGHAIKKQRVTKVHPSPKRKLMLDAIVAGGRGTSPQHTN